MNEPMSLTKALKHYFGFLPGQTLGGFVAEIKALSDAERAFFSAELQRIGYTITAG